MNTTMTIEDSINALKHIADDHNCCAFTLDGVMEAVEKLQAENARLKVGWSEESGDCDRWLCEVLTDFRIPFDDHKVGRRMALTGWMRDHN